MKKHLFVALLLLCATQALAAGGTIELDRNQDGKIDDEYLPLSIARKSDLAGKQDALGYMPENPANKGVANGYAALGADGKVPSSQLPAGTGGGGGVTSYNDLTDKPIIPTALSQLAGDANHRSVTDANMATWSGKQNALGYTPEDAAKKGAANGYAALGADGKVPSSQLPAGTGGGGSATLPDWLPAAGPTAGRQIIQAIGGCSDAAHSTQAACETASGTWTALTAAWTSTIQGLINDGGTGTDDLWSAGQVISYLKTPGPIGSIAPNTGKFTTLTATTIDTTPPATGETGEIALSEDPANGNNIVTIKAPAALAADLVFTLPSTAAPAADTALVGSPTGQLRFAPMNANLAELAGGWLSGSKVGTGIAAGNITAGTLPDARLSAAVPKWGSVPATATATCVAGAAAYDASYLYVCVATDTWRRAAISTW